MGRKPAPPGWPGAERHALQLAGRQQGPPTTPTDSWAGASTIEELCPGAHAATAADVVRRVQGSHGRVDGGAGAGGRQQEGAFANFGHAVLAEKDKRQRKNSKVVSCGS
eukprot:COSAG04_NODE_1870_length_5345_cov_9.554878_1_plen_108_part_10